MKYSLRSLRRDATLPILYRNPGVYIKKKKETGWWRWPFLVIDGRFIVRFSRFLYFIFLFWETPGGPTDVTGQRRRRRQSATATAAASEPPAEPDQPGQPSPQPQPQPQPRPVRQRLRLDQAQNRRLLVTSSRFPHRTLRSIESFAVLDRCFRLVPSFTEFL